MAARRFGTCSVVSCRCRVLIGDVEGKQHAVCSMLVVPPSGMMGTQTLGTGSGMLRICCAIPF